MTPEELYNHIIKHMTPEEALKKLLHSSLRTYENLKFKDGDDPVHPIMIMTMAALDMGWMLAVETNPTNPNADMEGIVLGTQEYMDRLLKPETNQNDKSEG